MDTSTQNASGGSPNANSSPNATFSRQDLQAWLAEAPENIISYGIMRNPTTMYKYIRENYGDAFTLLKDGAQATMPVMDSMQTFLDRQYGNLAENQRKHFLATIIQSLPKVAELQNWTTPVN